MNRNEISIEELYQIYLAHPKVITDSRQIEPGCLFFALKGDRFNGNAYAQKALDQGAAFAIIDEAAFKEGDRFLLVNDVLATLQALANFHRRQFEIPVIAITGTNGKTTTKELVSAVLSSHYPTHFTKGNFNNHIGVPLTLLALRKGTEVAIVEMGANHVGEINALCQIAEPTHGLITNVGKAHLEGFGDFEGVKQTKSELYRYLAARNGMVFINQDEPFLSELASGNRFKLFYHQSDTPHPEHIPFEVKLYREVPTIKCSFLDENKNLLHVESSLMGHYNFNNIMTAIVLGKYFKVPGHKIKTAIETYIPTNNRSQTLTIGTNNFLLDAYNANPTSIKNALSLFSKMEAEKKIAILGAMKELGQFSEAEHQEVVEHGLASGIDQLVLVGPEFEKAAQMAGLQWFANTAELKSWFDEEQFSDTHFLIKGSRSIGLEKLIS